MNEEFQLLYKTYSKEIYRFLLKLVGYREDLAEELTQETFYQTFLSLHRYRGDCDIKSYICQIAKNTCYKYFKKNPLNQDIDSEDLKQTLLTTMIGPEECIEHKELSNYVRISILNMKRKYREEMVLRVYFELSFQQISQRLSISENSAKVIFYRGKDLLKRELEEKAYGTANL